MELNAQLKPAVFLDYGIHFTPPYIFSQEEVVNLIEMAGQIKPANSMRPLMLSTLFGLLAATGLRISEALALRMKDITDDGLLILETKFQKSRLLPLHPTTRAAIDRYLVARKHIATDTDALFVGLNRKTSQVLWGEGTSLCG